MEFVVGYDIFEFPDDAAVCGTGCRHNIKGGKAGTTLKDDIEDTLARCDRIGFQEVQADRVTGGLQSSGLGFGGGGRSGIFGLGRRQRDFDGFNITQPGGEYPGGPIT